MAEFLKNSISAEIATMVALLASDLSASITGTVVTIDGGYSSR